MAISQTTLYCKQCDGMTLHQKSVFGVGWGLLLTLITGGFFLPFWILLAIVDSARPYRCVFCSGTGAGVRPAGAPGPGPAPLRGPFPSQRPAHGAPAAAGPFPHAATRVCPRCRASLPAAARFCRDCGTPLDPA